jgi:quercetin dioxygenase-like cupin family protein
MSSVPQPQTDVPPIRKIAAGEDLFGEARVAAGSLAFKVVPPDPSGLLIFEMTFQQKGGPARHLHLDQDEWFYVVEGEFIMEVGQERMRLNPGDSILAPRKVPHVWAYVSDTPGRMLFTFLPAGKMEAFMREIAKASGPAPQEPGFWRTYDLELVGPPLAIE